MLRCPILDDWILNLEVQSHLKSCDITKPHQILQSASGGNYTKPYRTIIIWYNAILAICLLSKTHRHQKHHNIIDSSIPTPIKGQSITAEVANLHKDAGGHNLWDARCGVCLKLVWAKRTIYSKIQWFPPEIKYVYMFIISSVYLFNSSYWILRWSIVLKPAHAWLFLNLFFRFFHRQNMGKNG